VFLARALGELTRHPRPLVPLSMLHALEVARYALVLVAVLVPARAPTSAAALALALLAVGSTDVPACAVMLAIAALLAPLGAVHLAAAAGPLPHPSGLRPPTAPGAPEEPSPPVTPGGLPPARADAPESLEAARSPDRRAHHRTGACGPSRVTARARRRRGASGLLGGEAHADGHHPIAERTSASGGRVGEMRMLVFFGARPPGTSLPAGVSATPASLASATTRSATGRVVSRLTK
jgi:hypothetical protein